MQLETWYCLDDLPNEIWKDVTNYEGLYMISSYGRLKSLKRNTAHERIMKPRVGKDGYYYCGLTKNGITKSKKIHRLVAMSFLYNVDNLPQVNHIDGCKTNNVLDNLEFCTASYNCKHAYKLGLNKQWMTGKTGKDCPFSKKIYQFDLDGKFLKEWDSISDVSRALGIPVAHLVRVCKGQRKTTRGFIWKYAREGD